MFLARKFKMQHIHINLFLLISFISLYVIGWILFLSQLLFNKQSVTIFYKKRSADLLQT